MKYAISYQSILQLRKLTSQCTNLHSGELSDFTDDIKQGIRVLLLTTKKDFLERLLRNKLVTNEISSAAEKVTRQQNGKNQRLEQDRIIKTRIRIKIEEIEMARRQWIEVSRRAVRRIPKRYRAWYGSIKRARVKELDNLMREVCDGTNVDFTRLRVTQFNSNKIIHMPQPLSDRNELKIENQKQACMDSLNEYIGANCNDKLQPNNGINLTPQELKGKNEIIEGIKNKGWVLGRTDKSDRLVLDTELNYLNSMREHGDKDPNATWEDVRQAEDVLYTHSSYLCNIVNLGKNAGENQHQRIKESMKCQYSGVPEMIGLRKDHKKDYDPVNGPPCRPLVDAKIGPNAILGNLINRIIKPVRKELSERYGYEIINTEELMRSFSDFNQNVIHKFWSQDGAVGMSQFRNYSLSDSQKVRDAFSDPSFSVWDEPQPQRLTCSRSHFKLLHQQEAVKSNKQGNVMSDLNQSHLPPIQKSDVFVVGSMDVKQLYPNCKLENVYCSIIQAFKLSNLVFDNINRDFLVRYVSLCRGGKTDSELDKYLPKPKPRTTLKSFLREQKADQFFRPNAETVNMSDDEVRLLLGYACAESTKIVMSNHFYTIGGALKRQLDGGSTGMDLTVEIASLCMLIFDISFNEKCATLNVNIALYKRFVDDIDEVLHEITEGWFYDIASDKMVFDLEHPYSDLKGDQRTLSILCDIANQINQNIQFTFECPSLFENEKLPILDLFVWIDNCQVKHSFYKKPISSNYTILKRSAISNSIKRNAIFQEGLRRVKNCSDGINDIHITNILTDFSNMLRISGYGEQYRFNVINGVIQRSKALLNELKQNGKPLHRNRNEIVECKRGKTGQFVNTWFLRGDMTSVIKVQGTPNSLLAQNVYQNVKSHRNPNGGTIKVVEKGGKLIGSGMQKHINENVPCSFSDPMCTVSGKVKCDTARIVYELTCMSCFKPPTFSDVDSSNIHDLFRNGASDLEFQGLGNALREVLEGNGDGFKCAYYGTSGHSGHKRALEHVNALQKKNMSYAMTKHYRIAHPDVNTNQAENLVRFKIISSTIKFNLQRFISEAFLIEKMDQYKNNIKVLNSKSEWATGRLRRLTVVDT